MARPQTQATEASADRDRPHHLDRRLGGSCAEIRAEHLARLADNGSAKAAGGQRDQRHDRNDVVRADAGQQTSAGSRTAQMPLGRTLPRPGRSPGLDSSFGSVRSEGPPTRQASPLLSENRRICQFWHMGLLLKIEKLSRQFVPTLCHNMFEHRHTGNMKPVGPQPNSTVESAGQKLTSAVLADLEMQDLEPDAREVELLARAAKAADRIEHLEAIVASEGATFRNKSGVVFPSPLLAEIRLQDGILMQALRGIKMEPAKTPAGKDAAKSRAGQASWRARQARAIPIGGIK